MEMFGKPGRELSEVERTMAGILAHLRAGRKRRRSRQSSGAEPEPPKPEPKRPKVELPPVKPVEPPKPTGPRPEYKVDRDFEERAIEKESRPKKSRRPVLIVKGICAVIVIAALAISLFLPGGEGRDGAEPTPPADTAQGGVPGGAEPRAHAGTHVRAHAEPDAEPDACSGAELELFMADCSWRRLRPLREKGGHLAVISSVTELSKVVDLAEEAGAQFVWIGLHRVDGRLVWVTGRLSTTTSGAPASPPATTRTARRRTTSCSGTTRPSAGYITTRGTTRLRLPPAPTAAR